MAEELPDLVARIRLDESQLGHEAVTRGRAFGTRFGTALGGQLRSSLGHHLRNALAAGLAIAGIREVGEAIKGMVEEARESEKVGRITETRLKSTGEAAHISAQGVEDLAKSISEKVGVDDEAIQSGENLLLAFTNVRDEVGKGNDIFDRATQLTTDLAASMHQGTVDAAGLKAANVQLGKALNDPIKGLGALSRVGVTFDDQQKKRIKRWVEEGDTVKAQKFILDQLDRKFGGTAAASAEMSDKLRVTWDNIKEDLGKILIPAIDFAEGSLKDLLQGLQGEKGKGDVPWARTAGRDLRRIGAVINEKVIPPIQDLVGWIRDQLIPAVQDAQAEFGPDFADALSSVADSLNEIGDAFSFLSDSSDSSTTSTKKDVRTLAAVVAGSAKAMAFNFRLVAWALRGIVAVGRWVAIRFLSTVSNMIGGLDLFVSAAAKVPGPLKDDFQRADKALDSTRDHIHNIIEGLQGIHSPPPITVKVKGGAATIASLAEIAWRTRQIPREVTINTFNRLQNVPVRAGGGQIRNGMAALVGDQGPELVRATPAGLVVTPHSASRQQLDNGAGDLGVLAAAVAALARRPVQLVLDGRVIAEVSDRRIGRSVGLGALA